MKAVLFDPKKADLDTMENVSAYGNRMIFSRWIHRVVNWWGGTSIATPTIEMVVPAKTALGKIRRLVKRYVEDGDSGALLELNSYYWSEVEACRSIIRKITCEPDAEVVFEVNGTSALSMVRNMLDINSGELVLLTTDTGRYIRLAMTGSNPWAAGNMFKPNMGVFYSHKRIEFKKFGVRNRAEMVKVFESGGPRPDQEFLEEVRGYLSDKKLRMVVMPQVSSSGRILPVVEIGELIREENRKRRKKIIYVVDAIQAVGRVAAEEVKNPLRYCDFYIFTSSKSLGAILATSAIIADRKLVVRQTPTLLKSPFSQYIRFFEFSRENKHIQKYLSEREHHTALSLPELASFKRALHKHYYAGDPTSYMRAREGQLAEVRAYRKKLIKGLKSIEGVLVLEDSENAPIVPSIVAFTLDRKVFPNTKLKDVKEKLQSGEMGKIIVLGAFSAQPKYFRLGIPEYKTKPSISVLVESLRKILDAERQ